MKRYLVKNDEHLKRNRRLRKKLYAQEFNPSAFDLMIRFDEVASDMIASHEYDHYGDFVENIIEFCYSKNLNIGFGCARGDICKDRCTFYGVFVSKERYGKVDMSDVMTMIGWFNSRPGVEKIVASEIYNLEWPDEDNTKFEKRHLYLETNIRKKH